MPADWKNPETEVAPRNLTTVSQQRDVNAELLRDGFLGQDFPGGAVSLALSPDGSIRLVVGPVGGKYVGRVKRAAAEHAFIFEYVLEEALDFNLQEALNLIAEGFDTGALPAVADANNGRVLRDQQRHLLHFYVGIGAGNRKRLTFNAIEEGVESDPIEMTFVERSGGADAFTKDGMPGTRLDALGEKVKFLARVPKNLVAADFNAVAHVQLGGVETANDNVELKGTIQSINSLGDESLAKAGTVLATTVFDILGNNSDGALQFVPLVVDHDDGANPVSGGELVIVEFELATLTTIGDINIFGAHLSPKIYKSAEEEGI